MMRKKDKEIIRSLYDLAELGLIHLGSVGMCDSSGGHFGYGGCGNKRCKCISNSGGPYYCAVQWMQDMRNETSSLRDRLVKLNDSTRSFEKFQGLLLENFPEAFESNF